MVEVKLVSDFLDYYDHMFDMGGITYKRMSTHLTRSASLHVLELLGLQVPVYDQVQPLASKLEDADKIVIYQDPVAHRGEGKLLTDVITIRADRTLDTKTASRYIEPSEPVTSYRYLRIGSVVEWLKYRSNDAWRSNCGEVDITAVDKLVDIADFLFYPLLAIDFVESKDAQLYAIDLNTAPGLKGTPIEEEFSATVIVSWIKDWFLKQGFRDKL